jgi:hypothetical protein
MKIEYAVMAMMLIGMSFALSINISPIIVSGNVVGYNTHVIGSNMINGLVNYSSPINITISGLPLNVSYNSSDVYNNAKNFKTVPILKVNKNFNINVGEAQITNSTFNYTITPPPTLNVIKTLACGTNYTNADYGIEISSNNCINKTYNLTYPTSEIVNPTYNYTIIVNPTKLNINKTLGINGIYKNSTFNITLSGISSNSLDNITVFNYTFLEKQYNNRYNKGCNFTVIKDNFSYCASGLPELFYGSVISNKNITEGWGKALTLFIRNVTYNTTIDNNLIAFDSNQISQLQRNLTNIETGIQQANNVSSSYNNLIDIAGEVALIVAIFIIILVIYNEHRKRNLMTSKRV